MRQVLPPLPGTRTVLVAVALAALLACALAIPAMAAEPSAAPLDLLAAGDPRSEGGGPGLVGSPLAVMLGVVALGLVTALATALATVALVRLRSR